MLLLLALGYIIGVILCSIWDKYLAKLYLIKKLRASLYEILEHYHWGILCLIAFTYINIDILLGLGLALIIDERMHNNPFGIKKTYFMESFLLGLILIWIYVILNLWRGYL